MVRVPPRGNGINARLEHVTAGPFHQSGINLPAHFIFKDDTGLFLGYGDAVHHAAVDVQGISLHRGAGRQGIGQFAFHHAAVGIAEYQSHFRFRQVFHHTGFDFRLNDGNGTFPLAAFRLHERGR